MLFLALGVLWGSGFVVMDSHPVVVWQARTQEIDNESDWI